MNVFKYILGMIEAGFAHLAEKGVVPAGLDLGRVTVEPPREAALGDVATNAAMVMAGAAGMKPRDLGAALAGLVAENPEVVSADVAGPGFINMTLAPDFWQARVVEILGAGTAYGDSDGGAGRAVNLEYVSANPTGPLHVGHGRGAVVGDALAALLAKAGYDVTREYYVNDLGAQVDILARSAHLRYREALGEDIGEIPQGYYPGDYLKMVGEAMARCDGDKWAEAPEQDWLPILRDFAVDAMMEMIRADLDLLGIRHDVFTSERALAEAGAIEEVVNELTARDLVYEGTLDPPKGKPLPDDWEARPQTLFRATGFSDDVDRPLKKSDGSWTYFASDIAYHRDKYRRGFNAMVDVWGTDHKGYVKRMEAAVEAVTEGGGSLDVRLCNLVNLSEGGRPVKMSKRAGAFVTLRDVINRVGRDVVRFIMLTRNNEAALDFDLATVMEQSRDNPVFYVQYAHARVCSLLRNAAKAFPDMRLDDSSLAAADLSRLDDPGELAMMKLLAGWPRVVESAAEAHEPHRVAYFLMEFAASFHGFWARGNEDEGLRFIVPADAALTLARLALARAAAVVIASGLAVMGVEPVEEMR